MSVEPESPAGALASAPEGSRAFERALLAAAGLLGLLRFVRLGAPSLWFDEVATWTDAWHGLGVGQISNPLGYRLVAGVAALFGPAPDELALRLVPAVAGWLAIPLTWWAFRPAAGGRRAAFAALLVATSSWHVSWSQTARFYTLAQLCALVAGAIWLRALARGRLLPLLGVLLFLALGAACHPTVLLLGPALVLAPLALRLVGCKLPPEAGRPVLVSALLALVGAAAATPWALEAWRNYVWQKSVGSALGSLAHTVRATGFHVSPLLGAAALAGTFVAWRRRESRVLLVALVPALVLCEALAAALGARVAAQYVFFALPWIALAAAAPLPPPGAANDLEARTFAARAPAFAYAFVLVAVSLSSVALYLTVRRGERPPWREAFALVERERGPHDLVLAMEASVAEHYLDPGRTWLREVDDVAWLDLYRPRRFERWTPHARTTWIVLNPEQLLGWEQEDADDLRRFLREECRLVAAFPLYVESRDLSVWVWKR